MRHLLSLVVALVLGAAIYLLVGIFLTRTGAPGTGWSGDTILGFAAAAGAGVAYALMLLPRMSPLGPFLVGLAFAGIVGWLYADPGGFARAVPEVILDSRRIAAVPFLAIFALPLLATVVMGDRWRRYAPVAALAPLPAQQQHGPGPQPDYATTEYGQPQYPPLGTPYSGPPPYQPDPPPWGGPPPADSETTHRL